MLFGEYLNCAIAVCTLASASRETEPELSTRDTVALDTPAALATSSIVTAIDSYTPNFPMHVTLRVIVLNYQVTPESRHDPIFLI